MRISFRKKTVLAGIMIMGILLLMGCTNRQEEPTEEMQETIILSSEEETETESKTEEAVTESYGASKESEEPAEEEWEEKYTVENVSVESEIMKRFLEGEEEATFTESYLAKCDELGLLNQYEGTLDEIVEAVYENYKKRDEHKISDLKVSANALLIRNGEVFTHILIRGEPWKVGESYREELIMVLKEDEDRIRICFQDEYPYGIGLYHFGKNGLIGAAGNGGNHVYYRDYYLDEAGDIYELYRCEEYHVEIEGEEAEALGMEKITERDAAILRYFLDGETFYTFWFRDGIKEEDQKIIKKYVIENKCGEKMIDSEEEELSYITEEEMDKKIEAYVASLGIDPAVLYEWEEIY